MDKLLSFQRVGVQHLIRNRHFLLADDMGLGKTVQAIKASVLVRAENILVLCPSSLKISWRDEFEAWSNYDDIHIIFADKDVKYLSGVVIVNYELLLNPKIFSALNNMHWCVCICDEAHYLKSYCSKRTKLVLGSNGVIRNAKYKWLLTGTPLLNRPVELYPILSVLASDLIKPYDTFHAYTKQYCGGYYDGDEWVFKGATNLEDLAERIKPFYLRRKKTDVLTDLPEKKIEVVKLPITQDMEEVFEYEETDESIGKLSTIRRLTSEAKVKQVTDIVVKRLTVDKIPKIVLFAHHNDVINKLLENFKHFNPVVMRGGMTPQKKNEAISLFVEMPETRIFIGQIQAAGIGINGLQKVCNHVIFAEFGWTPGEVDQAMDRVHRLGQIGTEVTIELLVAEGTIEMVMLRVLNKKYRIIEKVI